MADQVTRSPETLRKVQEVLDGVKPTPRLHEAAEAVEPAMRTLMALFVERGLDPDQIIFALALVTINFREQMPERHGGKEEFDRIAHEAHKYYQANE